MIDWNEPRAAALLAEVAAEHPTRKARTHRRIAKHRLMGWPEWKLPAPKKRSESATAVEQSAADDYLDYLASQW